jgi:uncharacterized protein DUF4238
MYAIRKSDLKVFTPRAEDVCRIPEGNTNAYLENERLIEEFLKTIEPKYNAAVSKLASRQIDHECIYTISGFVAYVITCSPAGMRIQSGPLRSFVEAETALMDARGALRRAPAILGGATLSELIRDGIVKTTIDPKYPQAIGIESILRNTARFGNFKWEILHNDSGDNPFFTSDFPAAIEETNDPRVLNRIVPLAPDLALRIKPDTAIDKDGVDFSFAKFAPLSHKLGRDEVVRLNQTIVRCAEDFVFYRDDRSWVRSFVSRNRWFRVEPWTAHLPTGGGTLLVSTQRVVARPPSSRPNVEPVADEPETPA